MPRVIDKETGQSIAVADADVQRYLASGLYEAAGEVAAELQPGMPVRLPASELAQRQGSRALSPEDIAAQTEQASLEATYGDEDQRTFVEGVGSALTLGATDLLQRHMNELDPLGNEGARTRAELNPGARIAGEVVGSLAPVIPLKGGAGRALGSTPAGLVERAGAAAGRVGGKGFKGTALRGATEGGLSAVGSTVSQLALDDGPITAERIAGSLGSNVLFGVGIGSGTSILGKAAGKGLSKAKGVVDDATARIGRIGEAVPGSQVVDDLRAYRGAVDDVNPFIAAEGEAKKVLTRSKQAIRYALDNPDGLARSPGRVMDALEREGTALKRAIADAPEMAAKLAKEDAKLIKTLAAAIDAGGEAVELEGKLARRYADFTDTRLPKGGKVAVPLEEAASFRSAFEAGEVAGRRQQSLSQLPDLLAKNKAMQEGVKAAIEAAQPSLLQRGAEKGLKAIAGRVVGGGVGAVFGGGIGAWVGAEAGDALVNLVVPRMGKASAEVSKRISGALDVFMSGAKAAERVAPIAATKVLTSVAFGPETEPQRRQVPSKDGLVTAYRKREAEIRAQTTLDPATMKPVMKPQARAQVAERLKGVRALQPVLADRIETVAARKMAFLADKLPKRPDAFATTLGPDRWHPSPMQMAKFARYVAAAEDPAGIVERLNDGSLTPEDAEVLKGVYPEMFAALQAELVARLPQLQKELPYQRRLMLSILTGVPVDPSMQPAVLRQLQASFTNEPGTEGGVQAPVAKPQFGSISKQEATPAQTRASR